MAEANVSARRGYPLPVERALILAVLLALAAIAWGALVWQADSMDMNMGPMQAATGEMTAAATMNDGGAPTGGAMTSSDDATMAGDEMAMTDDGTSMDMDLTMNMGALLFLAVWVAMMVAMMFPTAAPMILTFAAVQNNRRQGGGQLVPTWLFTLAYIALWSATGFIAYGAAVGGDALASEVGWIADNAGRLGGVLLVVAGAYQLSPWKDKCLSQCRTPTSFILASWREGPVGAMRMGLEHGAYCLGGDGDHHAGDLRRKVAGDRLPGGEGGGRWARGLRGHRRHRAAGRPADLDDYLSLGDSPGLLYFEAGGLPQTP